MKLSHRIATTPIGWKNAFSPWKVSEIRKLLTSPLWKRNWTVGAGELLVLASGITVLWCSVRRMRKWNERNVIQKGTSCITRIQDLTVEVKYSLWDLMTKVFWTTACYTSDGSLYAESAAVVLWFSARCIKNFILSMIYVVDSTRTYFEPE
jgi:hypothetical protein